MAGTTLTWKTTNIAQNAGQLFYNLALPGAGAKLTLDATTKTPDSTANPSAKHAGATTGGSKVMAKSSNTKYYVDEFRAPIVTSIDTVEMGISAEVVGVTDSEFLAFLLPGVGTYATGSGFKEVRIGTKAITYSSIALIYPLIEDTTKVGVFHLYSAINDVGVEWAVSRKALGSTPVSFVGYEITTRAATDTIGNIWNEIA
jgi:hypothetical protein